MKASEWVISVVVVLASANAHGADCAMSPEALNIRKSFVFSKDEQEPARITAQNIVGEKNSITLVDIGVRIKPYDCGNYRFVPIIEYHKDSSSTKPVDNLSANLKIEAEPSFLDFTTANYTAVLDIMSSYKKDMESGISSGNLSALVYGSKTYGFSVFGARLKHAVPSTLEKTAEESLLLQTIPYIGLDHYAGIPELISNTPSKTNTINASYAVFRYYVEYWPLPHFNKPGLQLLANVNYRKSIGGGVNHPKSFGVSANYYIDEKSRVAIGIDYEKGNIQTANFVDSEKTSVSFKVKF